MNTLTKCRYGTLETKQGVSNLISILERSELFDNDLRLDMLKQLRQYHTQLSDGIDEMTKTTETMMAERRANCTHKTVIQYVNNNGTYCECTHCGAIIAPTEDTIILHKIENYG